MAILKRKYKRKVKAKGKVSEAVKSYVQKKIEGNIEHKQMGVIWAANTVSNTVGTRLIINAPETATSQLIPGFDWDEYVGSEILVKEICVKGVVKITSLATSHYETVRAILMYEKQPEGVPFAGAEFFLDVTAGRTVFSDFNAKHKHRFVILSDKTYDLNDYSAGIAGGGTKKHISLTHTFKKPIRQVMYNNPGGSLNGVAALEKTAIYMVLICGANVTYEGFTTSMKYLDA